MGVSKNSGTPKWMVYFMENPIKIDDLGVPLFLETPIYFLWGYNLHKYLGCLENIGVLFVQWAALKE